MKVIFPFLKQRKLARNHLIEPQAELNPTKAKVQSQSCDGDVVLHVHVCGQITPQETHKSTQEMQYQIQPYHLMMISSSSLLVSLRIYYFTYLTNMYNYRCFACKQTACIVLVSLEVHLHIIFQVTLISNL